MMANRWSRRTVVVKYGGATVGSPGTFAGDVVRLRAEGARLVVVHGGGVQITALSRRLGLTPHFVDGRRVTDEATLECVRLALLGDVNPRLVNLLGDAGVPAAGVAGTDTALLRLRPVDELGLVGEVSAVEPALLEHLLSAGFVPVVAGLGRDALGVVRNVNADSVAAAVAAALRADALVLLSDVAGVYEGFGTAEQTLLQSASVPRLRALLAGGDATSGMIPKVRALLSAAEAGVPRCHVVDGREAHALTRALDGMTGTTVSAAVAA